MFQFLRIAVRIVAPIFVISTMLNVGLTQRLSEIVAYLKNYRFVLKMLLANDGRADRHLAGHPVEH